VSRRNHRRSGWIYHVRREWRRIGKHYAGLAVKKEDVRRVSWAIEESGVD